MMLEAGRASDRVPKVRSEPLVQSRITELPQLPSVLHKLSDAAVVELYRKLRANTCATLSSKLSGS